jgi:hypothetical protein
VLEAVWEHDVRQADEGSAPAEVEGVGAVEQTYALGIASTSQSASQLLISWSVIVLHELARKRQREKIIKAYIRLTSALRTTLTEGLPPRSIPAVMLVSRCGATLPVASILPKSPIADLDMQYISGIFRSDYMRPYQDADLRRQAGD